MRNKTPTLGQKKSLPKPQTIRFTESDPLSPAFSPKVGNTPKELIKYLVAEQQRAYGKTVLEQFSHAILVRNFKLLLKKYTPDQIKRGIALSVRTANHPATTRYISECIEKWLTASDTQVTPPCPPMKK